MNYDPAKPLIVQSDLTMLLEVDSSRYDEVRDAIAPFSEIIKSPEHVHTYRMTPISLWNAASAGLSASEVMRRLLTYSRFEISASTLTQIKELMGRYGQIKMEPYDGEHLKLITSTPVLMSRFFRIDEIHFYLMEKISPTEALIKSIHRGLVKQALIKEGYPVMDLAGYTKGADLEIEFKPDVYLRPYQCRSRDSFLKGGSHLGGCGVVVLPCGAGKTIVGMAVMAEMKTHTLILVTGTTAARQWRQELLNKTSVPQENIGEFTGAVKEIKPVTIATYHILTHRHPQEDEFIHFDRINNHSWGLIIYDEVHLLPAQMFRFTASLQAIRRLGLTATLVREDNKESDVFSLIGPKSYDLAWKEVERQGWIAKGYCHEIRVDMDPAMTMAYVTSPKRQRFRTASENPAKKDVIKQLLSCHNDESVLIIGQYLSQLQQMAEALSFPLITGQTPQEEREILYAKFKSGAIKTLIVSSVANFSIDLPDASVAIQISGKFGSRQEEAQRLGRILRPKADHNVARFYTLVSAGTEEQDFALNRQLFLTEQGYSYTILHEDELEPYFNENTVAAVKEARDG